jgi:hypothetical protein
MVASSAGLLDHLQDLPRGSHPRHVRKDEIHQNIVRSLMMVRGARIADHGEVVIHVSAGEYRRCNAHVRRAARDDDRVDFFGPQSEIE